MAGPFKDLTLRELIAAGFNVDIPIRLCKNIPGGISQIQLTTDRYAGDNRALVDTSGEMISINLPPEEE